MDCGNPWCDVDHRSEDVFNAFALTHTDERAERSVRASWLSVRLELAREVEAYLAYVVKEAS